MADAGLAPSPRLPTTKIHAQPDRSHFDEAKQAYFLEYDNNGSRFEAKVPLSGKITGPIFTELAQWYAAHSGERAIDPKTYDADSTKFVHELLMKYAGPYHAETARVLEEVVRPLQIKASEKEDLVRDAEKTIKEYNRAKDAAGLKLPGSYGVLRYPELTEADRKHLTADEWKRYQELKDSRKKMPPGLYAGGVQDFCYQMEGRVCGIHTAEMDLSSRAGRASNYLKQKGLAEGKESDIENLTKEEKQRLIDIAVTQAEETGVRLEKPFRLASEGINQWKRDAADLRKRAEAVPMPIIPGESLGRPVDINNVGYGNMVCRHRAPLAHAMLQYVGCESELLNADMLAGRTQNGHVTVYMPGIRSIFEPSSDSYSLAKISGPFEDHRGEKKETSITTGPGLGYALEYSDIVLPRIPRPAGADVVQDLRRRAANDYHLDEIAGINPTTVPRLSPQKLFDLAGSVAADYCYLYKGEKSYMRADEIRKLIPPGEQRTFDRLLKLEKLFKNAFLNDTRGAYERWTAIEENIQTAASDCYSRSRSQVFAANVDQILGECRLSGKKLTDQEKAAVAFSVAEEIGKSPPPPEPRPEGAVSGAIIGYSGIDKDYPILVRLQHRRTR